MSLVEAIEARNLAITSGAHARVIQHLEANVREIAQTTAILFFQNRHCLDLFLPDGKIKENLVVSLRDSRIVVE